MKKYVILVLAALAVCSCVFSGVTVLKGNGVAVDTVIDVDGFNAVSLPASTDVVYKIAEGDRSVVLTCDEKLVDHYFIHVEDGILYADVKPGAYSVFTKVQSVLTVCAPVLEGVTVTGSGDCTVIGPVSTDSRFYLKCSGSGDVSVSGRIDCPEFTATTSGSGDISVGAVCCESSAGIRTTGSGDIDISAIAAQSVDISSSGSGDLSVEGITADSINARTSGSGDIDLVCKDAGVVDARTSGSGDISLRGTARSVQTAHSGSGDVLSGGLRIL
ncbi:MAG: DUF2807 domain-containing protein [Bacteroidales bacterium]|nr:DUF2807 domain-containing protein [Bacteroidales bacterium]